MFAVDDRCSLQNSPNKSDSITSKAKIKALGVKEAVRRFFLGDKGTKVTLTTFIDQVFDFKSNTTDPETKAFLQTLEHCRSKSGTHRE